METWQHKLSVKTEAGEKLEMDLAVNLAGMDLNSFVIRGLKDFAANEAKVVRDGKMSTADFIAGFQQNVADYAAGVKKVREGGGITVDSTLTLANRILASVLKKKADADPNFAEAAQIVTPAVLDKKGNLNYIGWAKAIRDAEPEHKWVKKSYQDAQKDY